MYTTLQEQIRVCSSEISNKRLCCTVLYRVICLEVTCL